MITSIPIMCEKGNKNKEKRYSIWNVYVLNFHSCMTKHLVMEEKGQNIIGICNEIQVF